VCVFFPQLQAEDVLRSVHELGEPAHFIIIGCSGSGKTESAKLLFQYFAESKLVCMIIHRQYRYLAFASINVIL